LQEAGAGNGRTVAELRKERIPEGKSVSVDIENFVGNPAYTLVYRAFVSVILVVACGVGDDKLQKKPNGQKTLTNRGLVRQGFFFFGNKTRKPKYILIKKHVWGVRVA